MQNLTLVKIPKTQPNYAKCDMEIKLMGFYISTTMEIAIKNTLHATQMKNG